MCLLLSHWHSSSQSKQSTECLFWSYSILQLWYGPVVGAWICCYQFLSAPCLSIESHNHSFWQLWWPWMSWRGRLLASIWMPLLSSGVPLWSRLSSLGLTTLGGSLLSAASLFVLLDNHRVLFVSLTRSRGSCLILDTCYWMSACGLFSDAPTTGHWCYVMTLSPISSASSLLSSLDLSAPILLWSHLSHSGPDHGNAY